MNNLNQITPWKLTLIIIFTNTLVMIFNMNGQGNLSSNQIAQVVGTLLGIWVWTIIILMLFKVLPLKRNQS